MPVWSYSSQRTVFRSCFSPSIMWAPQVELVLLGLEVLFLAEDLSWPWPIWKWPFPSFAVFQFHLWIFSFVAWTISSNFVLLRDYLVKVLDTLISLHFCLFDYTVLKFFIWTCFILFYFVFTSQSKFSLSSSKLLLILSSSSVSLQIGQASHGY